MKIAFFIRHFGERGTEVAIYDYAHFNETLLGNTSIIIGFTPETYARNNLVCMPDILEKFCKRFPVYLVKSFAEVDLVLQQQRVDIYYTLTHGQYESHPFGYVTACKSIVHCVFETRNPHGDVYCTINQQLNDQLQTSIPVIPHMVRIGATTETLRSELGIPENAIVFGRHGAQNSFDIQIARDSVIEVASSCPSIYFLFMNTQKFCDLPNVIHLPKTIDIEAKQRFINTCDAYLHGGSGGETFGLAVGEFAVSNKPIIASTQWKNNAHLKILGNKAITYTTKDDLVNILHTFRRGTIDMTSNGYKEYTPERVMTIFRNVVGTPFTRFRPPFIARG
jgi:hypothetical protein